MKGFVEEGSESSDHRNGGKERITGCRVLCFQSSGEINVNLKSFYAASPPLALPTDPILLARSLAGKLFHHQGGVVAAETE